MEVVVTRHFEITGTTASYFLFDHHLVDIMFRVNINNRIKKVSITDLKIGKYYKVTSRHNIIMAPNFFIDKKLYNNGKVYKIDWYLKNKIKKIKRVNEDTVLCFQEAYNKLFPIVKLVMVKNTFGIVNDITLHIRKDNFNSV